jgi:hypothetical protein
MVTCYINYFTLIWSSYLKSHYQTFKIQKKKDMITYATWKYYSQELSQNCEKRLLTFSCLPVGPSFRLHGIYWLSLYVFSLNLVLELFRKSLKKFQVSLIHDKSRKTLSRLWQHLVEFFLEWEIFQIKVVEKIKAHVFGSVTFFRKSCRLWDSRKIFWNQRGYKKYGACAVHAA